MGTLAPYINPKFASTLIYGTGSHYIRPHRGWFEVVSATQFLNGIGVNYGTISASQADAVAKHVASCGIKHLRTSLNWSGMDYTTLQFTGTNTILPACAKYGLRPLITLYAVRGAPCPSYKWTGKLAVAAKQGDTTLQFDVTTFTGSRTISNILPLYTGVQFPNDLGNIVSGFITSPPVVNGNIATVTLSKAVTGAAGIATTVALQIATLKYKPFYYKYPLDTSGNSITTQVTPEYAETYAGWQNYVVTAATYARQLMGTTGAADPGFDMEVWNEPATEHQFLNVCLYYDTAPCPNPDTNDKRVISHYTAYVQDYDLLNAVVQPGTVAKQTGVYHPLQGVGCGDSFQTQTPITDRTNNMPGGTAGDDRHFYPAYVPVSATNSGEPGQKWLDANLNADTSGWFPSYNFYCPEMWWYGLRGGTALWRIVNPVSQTVFGFPVGRNASTTYRGTGTALDGTVSPNPPTLWQTETGVAMGKIVPTYNDADYSMVKAKALLRSMLIAANKGPGGRVYHFDLRDNVAATQQGTFDIISPAFLQAVTAAGGAYPSNADALTSLPMASLKRAVAKFANPDPHAATWPLAALSVSDTHDAIAWAGDPATVNASPNPHPNFYLRDCVEVLPFQVDASTAVIPLYVAYPDMTKIWTSATDSTRYNLPDTQFTILLDGFPLDTAQYNLSFYDPISDSLLPVTATYPKTSQMAITAPLTDYPRLLTITTNPVVVVKGPPPPANLAASAGNRSVSLSWQPSANATSYTLYRSTTSGQEVLLTSGLTTLAYTDTGLTNGVTYYYVVTANNALGESAASNEASAAPAIGSGPTLPAAPTGLSATPGDSSNSLVWTPSLGATSYNIYRATVSGAENTPLATGILSASYTDSFIANGVQYYYEVTAVNAAGESAKSAEASGIPNGPTLPDIPTDLSALAANAAVLLAWDAISTAASYNVYRGTASGAEVQVAIGIAANTFTDLALVNGQTYYYYVTSQNSTGESAASGEVSATPMAPAIPAPPGVVVALPGNQQIILGWNASGGAASYNVYRGIAPGTEQLLQSSITSTRYIDSSLTNGQPYYYTVTAVNAGGESAASGEVSATPGITPLPTAPAGVQATSGTNSVTISWQPVAGALAYNLYRSVTPGGEALASLTNILGTTITDQSLMAGITYHYKVTAINLTGEGPKSAEVSAIPTAFVDTGTGTPIPAPYSGENPDAIEGQNPDDPTVVDPASLLNTGGTGGTGGTGTGAPIPPPYSGENPDAIEGQNPDDPTVLNTGGAAVTIGQTVFYPPLRAMLSNGASQHDLVLTDNPSTLVATLVHQPTSYAATPVAIDKSAQITFTLRPSDPATPAIVGASTPQLLTDGTDGQVAYNFTSADIAVMTPGQSYVAEFEVTFPNGQVHNFGLLVVRAHSPISLW